MLTTWNFWLGLTAKWLSFEVPVSLDYLMILATLLLAKVELKDMNYQKITKNMLIWTSISIHIVTQV